MIINIFNLKSEIYSTYCVNTLKILLFTPKSKINSDFSLISNPPSLNEFPYAEYKRVGDHYIYNIEMKKSYHFRLKNIYNVDNETMLDLPEELRELVI